MKLASNFGLALVLSPLACASSKEPCTLCKIREAHVATDIPRGPRDDSFQSYFACQIEEGQGRNSSVLEISLESVDLGMYGAEALHRGDWSLCVESLGQYLNEHKTNSSYIIPVPSDTVLRPTLAHRRLNPQGHAHRHGTKTLLVVRVQTDDHLPTESLEDLREAIFGDGRFSREVSVSSQYRQISHDKLRYVPAIFTGLRMKPINGVMDLRYERNEGLGGARVQLIAAELVEAVEKRLNLFSLKLEDVVHHTLFCFPPNTGAQLYGNAEWTAFTYLYEPYSFYQRNRCLSLSVVMHEVGHGSLGFQHSGRLFDEYGDETGYMGYSYNERNRGPVLKSMNAHKHWISGWFAESSKYVANPLNSPSLVRLESYSDYDDTEWGENGRALRRTNYVRATLVRLGVLYIQYNGFSEWNKDSSNLGRVTIVESETASSVSWLKASLGIENEKATYVVSNFMDSETSVQITLCDIDSMSNTAILSIHSLGGSQSTQCPFISGGYSGPRLSIGDPVAVLTPAPSLSPMMNSSPISKIVNRPPPMPQLIPNPNDKAELNFPSQAPTWPQIIEPDALGPKQGGQTQDPRLATAKFVLLIISFLLTLSLLFFLIAWQHFEVNLNFMNVAFPFRTSVSKLSRGSSEETNAPSSLATTPVFDEESTFT